MNNPALIKKEEHQVTAIIPIHDVSGRWENLERIVRSSPKEIVFVVLHDSYSPSEIRERPEFLRPSDTFISRVFGGPGSSRNEGLRHVKSEWVVFCDSDDRPNFKELLSHLEQLETKSFEIIIFQFSVLDLGCEQERRIDFVKPEISFARFPGIWRCAFRSKLISNINFPELSCGEDLVFLFRALRRSNQNPEFSFRSTYTYVKSENQTSLPSCKCRNDSVNAALIMAREGGIGKSTVSAAFEWTIFRIITKEFLVKPKECAKLFVFLFYRILSNWRLFKNFREILGSFRKL